MNPTTDEYLNRVINPILESHGMPIYRRGMDMDALVYVLCELIEKVGKKRGRKAKQ